MTKSMLKYSCASSVMEEHLNDCMYSWISAAAFFITYENVKSMLHHGSTSYLTPATHMVAASLGEVVRKKFIYCVSVGEEETIQLWKLRFGVISYFLECWPSLYLWQFLQKYYIFFNEVLALVRIDSEWINELVTIFSSPIGWSC